MKKLGEIMQSMGFQKDSSEETQKAFIKYLIRVANKNQRPLLELETEEADQWSELRLTGPQKDVDKALENPVAEQLSFGFVEDKPERKIG